MPNLTIFVAKDRMPSDAKLAELSARCTELCTGILRASLGNVHIIHVEAHLGRGHPVYVEVHYRLEAHRTSTVMGAFMDGLDEAVRTATGLAVRIRCFGFASPNIHARN